MIDVDRLMTGLAEIRPIFHNEADFQHALAWQIHQELPDCQVRLEYPFEHKGRQGYLDILLLDSGVAIELKYPTQKLVLSHGDEQFYLKDHSARDFGRYDFLKDVQRVEQLVARGTAKAGFAVFLTNDLGYLEYPSRSGTNDAAFRIHEGREITGKLDWSEKTNRKKTQGREEPVTLNGSYTLHWRDYSDLQRDGYTKFRYLAVAIGN